MLLSLLCMLLLFLFQTTVVGLVMVILFVVDLVSLFISHLTPDLPPHVLTPLYSTSPLTKEPHSVSATPLLCLMSAVDFNQFAFFILANLSTGLTNFAVDTMAAGPSSSLAILIAHMFLLCLTITVLHRHRIKLV